MLSKYHGDIIYQLSVDIRPNYLDVFIYIRKHFILKIEEKNIKVNILKNECRCFHFSLKSILLNRILILKIK